MNKGGIFVVSAPSGCGKGTILAEIKKKEGFYYSISATTREPREGEIDGINYHFIDKTKFEELISEGGLLEYAEYCGNYYGTLKKPVDDALKRGENVILEIEVKGALQVKEKCPEAAMVFILPPSFEELRDRLEKRGTESDELIEKRIEKAAEEISFAGRYDYIIENRLLETAVSDLSAVVRAENLKKSEETGARVEEILNDAKKVL